jgi:hypothetical protein
MLKEKLVKTRDCSCDALGCERLSKGSRAIERAGESGFEKNSQSSELKICSPVIQSQA